MNIEVLNIEGTKSKSVQVSDSFAGLKVNYKLLKYVIDFNPPSSNSSVLVTICAIPLDIKKINSIGKIIFINF